MHKPEEDMLGYDDSIEVCDEDDDYEQLVSGRGRPGVSPVRRPPFQRPSRSFARTRQFQHSESLEMSADEESPAPPSGQEDDAKSLRKLSSKDFALQDENLENGGKPENLMSMASSYAKKLMSSGSDRKKEKPPPDMAEVSRREQKAQPPEPRRAANAQSSTQPQQHHPPATQKSRSEEEEDDEEDDDDEEYDEMNMTQIEGPLRRVEKPHSGLGRGYPRPPQPQPPPGSPPSYPERRRIYAALKAMHSATMEPQPVEREAAGEPYSVPLYQRRPQPSAPDSLQPRPGFQHGFGPATASLMRAQLSDEDLSDAEISVAEGDMDLSKMERLMEMYGTDGHVAMDPALMMAMPPAPDLTNISVMDEEIIENVLTHRRMWEYSLDLKREKLRRRTLVMSDYLGVHSPGYEVYNPQDYEHLNVSPEIKELFHYITRYEPPMIGTQMDVKLKPFIPEYYPSVGDIDAFIKVTHPEVQDEALGIKHLDEPSPFQSDPSVLDLRLRALAKQSSSKSVTVKKIDNVGKNAKIIENWIKDISDLHRSKPSPSVHYSKPMPDIDSLIQEWPPQVENLLKNISLPASELDCDLATYVDIVCNLLDIPVYKSRIQSLHVLFTLYGTYKHFNHYGPLGGLSGEGIIGVGSAGVNDLDEGDVDRLQIN